ncbi:Os03g0116366 [Oryza sativa Japonica Group]|uniref:Os03g0116366 protein n=1 Tax=Oryza sativa subsp. japonica TaxID=39947 RepID=A0A0P0VSG6_ORYSJ|nr:hypothetical protein EE612_014930 [Oryza sativa]BAS81979.1 Os03g0116366 [Oryza sativa Japonica Group]
MHLPLRGGVWRGQLLAYMVRTKTTMLATRNDGTIHGTHSLSPSCCGYSGDGTFPTSFLLAPFSTSACDVAIAALFLALSLSLLAFN